MTKQRRKRQIAKTAKDIADERLIKAVKVLGYEDQDTGYDKLWDGQAWRLHQGSKKEIALMATARLGKLLIGYRSKTRVQNEQVTCAVCRSGHRESIFHVLESCKTYEDQRARMWMELGRTWSEELKSHFDALQPLDRVRALLGAQMDHVHADMEVKRATDRAVKSYLAAIDELRMKEFGLSSMVEPAQKNPIEVTMRLAHEWTLLREEEKNREQQGDGAHT
jgi:hypothetical protein